MRLIYSAQRRNFEQAGQWIERALKDAPDDGIVAAWAASWELFSVGQGWSRDRARGCATALGHAQRAVELDPNNAEALGLCGHICAFLNQDFESAVSYFDRALRLNPNLAYVRAFSALTYCYIGQPREALQRLQRYRQLAPSDPYLWCDNLYSIAYMFAGEYEQTVIVGRRAVKNAPGFSNAYKPLIAALGHLRRRGEARRYVDKLLELEPGFSVMRFCEVYPFKQESDRDRYATGLRLAGVPDE